MVVWASARSAPVARVPSVSSNAAAEGRTAQASLRSAARRLVRRKRRRSTRGIVRGAGTSCTVKPASLFRCRPALMKKRVAAGSICLIAQPPRRDAPVAGQKPLTRRLRLRFPRFSAARQVAAPLRKNGHPIISDFVSKCMTWFYYANAIRNRCHGPNLPVEIAFNYPSGITTLSFPSGTRLLLLLGWRRPATADGRRSSAVEPEAPARDAAPCGPGFLVSTALAPACNVQ